MLPIIAVAAVPTALVLTYAAVIYLVGRWFSKVDTLAPNYLAAQFLQGTSLVWNNPFFLGLASSKVFAPCLFMEILYNGNVLSWCLFVIRLAGLVICVTFWNLLYRQGFQSVGHYLSYHYNSPWIIGLYNINTLLGFVYIYKAELVPITYYFVEYLKTTRIQSYTFLAILLATSLGGFNLSMFSLTVLWVLDLAGQAITISSLHSLLGIGSPANASSIYYMPCLSNIGLPTFLPILSHMVAILPFYRYFRAAASLRKANTAMVICAILLACDQLWSMLLANKVLAIGNSQAAHQYGFKRRPSLWLRYFLEGVASVDGSKADIQTTPWQLSATNGTAFEHQLWSVTPGANIVLFWSVMGQLHMFSVVQLHSLTVHVLEHCLPTWLRDGLITSVAELKIIYISLRLLFSVVVFLIVAEGIYKLNHVAFKEVAFYTPIFESELTTIVATFTLLAPLLRSAGPSLMFPASVIQFVGIHFLLGMLARDRLEIDFVKADAIWNTRSNEHFQVGRLCGMVWVQTLMALSLLLVLGVMVFCFRFSRGALDTDWQSDVLEGSDYDVDSRVDSGA